MPKYTGPLEIRNEAQPPKQQDKFQHREPVVGERVLYVYALDKHLSAAVHAVHEEFQSVELRVHDPENLHGGFRAAPVSYDPHKSPGTWHYPEEG